jgi:DNA-binding CsgD family transcriptional regulator
MPPFTELPGPAAPSDAPLVGRAELLAAVEARTAAQASVLLTGPYGIGKSALLHAVAGSAAGRGELVLRTTCAAHGRHAPFAALRDLLGQVPDRLVAALPEPQHEALTALTARRPESPRNGKRPGAGREPVVRLALLSLLRVCASGRPVLVIVDDAQWLDTPSAEALRYAARRAAGRGLRLLAAGNRPDLVRRPWSLSPTAVDMPVPPLPCTDVAQLFEGQGLPARVALTLHADSGGNPRLAHALGEAFADRIPRHRRPAPLPAPVRATVTDRLASLPADTRDTLLTAALASRPTVPLLLRAGHQDAEADVRLAVTAGLLHRDGHALRFTPPEAAGVLAEYAGSARRTQVHASLATAVPDAAGRLVHRALAADRPDEATARALASAAREADGSGDHARAAELYLTAADRAPCGLETDRTDWLVRAAEAAAGAGLPRLVHRAADAVLAGDAGPAQRVRVRLALVDLAGRGPSDMDDVFAAAHLDAGDDPTLCGPLLLRQAWAAFVAGRTAEGERLADRAVACARSASDPGAEAAALAAKATGARLRGRIDHEVHLHRALRLPAPGGRPGDRLHMSPRFLAARFAVCDDRLAQARAALLDMLASVERGSGEETVQVLRGLSEVSVRTGRCREALDFADRAVRLTRQAGLSPAPAWYDSAVAELAGGSVARAARLAELGRRAAEEEGDGVFVARHLHVLGQARIREGDVRGGVAALLRVRELERRQGVASPQVRRWHGDLAAGLAVLGDVEQARAVLRSARTALGGPGRGGAVTGLLDRAHAAVRLAEGDADEARALLEGASVRFEELGLPLEAGQTLLELARLERRCRRHGAAREPAQRAVELFTRCGARPWIAAAERGGAAAGEPPVPRPVDLTATEEQIAVLVGQGATNNEVAARMYVSVKTVEASLTRVYRKLGLRSRTQLGSWLYSASRTAAG